MDKMFLGEKKRIHDSEKKGKIFPSCKNAQPHTNRWETSNSAVKKKLLAVADHKLHMNQQYHAVPRSLNIYYVYIYIGLYKQENRLWNNPSNSAQSQLCA